MSDAGCPDRGKSPATFCWATPMKEPQRTCRSRNICLATAATWHIVGYSDPHVAAFRDFLREQGGPTAEEQELLAAKLMGRWRSGAPLVLAPEKDDPSIADDPQRNNNFNYAKMDPQGYAVPLGSHIRRMIRGTRPWGASSDAK